MEARLQIIRLYTLKRTSNFFLFKRKLSVILYQDLGVDVVRFYYVNSVHNP